MRSPGTERRFDKTCARSGAIAESCVEIIANTGGILIGLVGTGPLTAMTEGMTIGGIVTGGGIAAAGVDTVIALIPGIVIDDEMK
jgi:hypothetical protein